MASLIGSAINGIFRAISAIQTLRDLFAGNARAGITVEELTRALRGELAAFFTLVELANLQSIHSQFYQVWLPSVANRNTISPNDINSPGGPLHHVFNSMLASIHTVFMTLNRMETVYRQHSNTFQVDRVVQSQIMFIEMYGLLLHMHSTCATLRRISVGASTLNDSRLLPDTLSALLYLDNMERVIIWAASAGQNRRLGTLGPVQFDHRGSHNGIPARRFFFEDTYRSSSDTPARNQSHIAPALYQRVIPNGPIGGPPPPTEPARRHVEDARAARVGQIRLRLDIIISGDGAAILRMIPSLRAELRQRERHQRNTSTRTVRSSYAQFQAQTTSPVTQDTKDEEDPGTQLVVAPVNDPHNLGTFILPGNVDEYLALSNYLSASTDGEDPESIGDHGQDLKCPSCQRDMKSLEPSGKIQRNTSAKL